MPCASSTSSTSGFVPLANEKIEPVWDSAVDEVMGNEDDEIFEPRKLKSPAQIEKLVGKKKFKDVSEVLLAIYEKSKGE